MKDSGGRIVADDFQHRCFLPVSCMAFVLHEHYVFTLFVAKHVKLPESSQLDALVTASFACVPFGMNMIGLPCELKKPKPVNTAPKLIPSCDISVSLFAFPASSPCIAHLHARHFLRTCCSVYLCHILLNV
ncbi:hypothetical protein PLICRDRAFT_281530 [Plicaturopsis crispa FD-325 SS-3]|nr:hypothetical protein PLICRDRAFT_281530 [Plicaturopsis crispa FD-325 SS-3]